MGDHKQTSNKNYNINKQVIRVAGTIPECVVNAPGGISYVIFAQGCNHKCPGCYNPETHDFHGGEDRYIFDIIEDIQNYPLSRIVTFTGGDPFYQPDSFYILARELRKLNYKLVGYSGFYFVELLQDSKCRDLLAQLDILIDGPFVLEQKDRELNFRGSRNQRILDVKESMAEQRPVSITKYYERS